MGNNLGLGKHCAGAGNISSFLGPQGILGHLIQLDLHDLGHGLKEHTGAGSALVLPGPVRYPSAVIDFQYRAGLGAQIYNHTGGG